MSFKRLSSMTAVGLCAVVLGGCIDVETNVVMQPDGSGLVTSRLIMDDGAVDAVKGLLALDEISGEQKLSQFSKGLCAGLIAQSNNPSVPSAPVSATLRVEELREGDKLVCQFTDRVPDFAKAMQNPLTMSVWSVTVSGGRHVVTFNPDAIPDLSIFADALLTGYAQDLIAKSKSTGQPRPDAQQLASDLRRGITGGIATFLSGRTVTLSVTGRSVVDTTGQLSSDNRTATYVVPTASVINALLGQKKRPLPAFRAVVQP